MRLANSFLTMCGAIVVLTTSACSRSDQPASSTAGDEIAFRNVVSSTGFVGSEACFDCHEDQYRGYQNHGMARSYYPLTPENRVEQVQGVTVRDPNSNLVYSIAEMDGALYQVEYDGSAGRPDSVLRRRMDFVVGSGNAARTYLTEVNGRLYQLPLTWYTQREKWDFSPGYRTENHRFSRLVPDRCMACHNGYPQSVPYVDGKYGEVPNGIGCERCHGPGELHVNERLEVPEPASDIDDSIVNPAHLPFDRRLDVCQQCHLHATVSILRENREPFGFRPSQSLADYLALFAEEKEGGESQIDVISHADRMRQSECFIATAATVTPMGCTTCHDPHRAFRDQGPGYFNATCIQCHGVDALQSRLAASDEAASHVADANCIDCHMPKVEAEDAPHSSFTDHRIRVVDEELNVPGEAAHQQGHLKAYFERDRSGQDGEIYAAMARVIYGRQIAHVDLMREGAVALTELLSADTTHGEAHYLRGLALHLLGDVEGAIPSLETAVRREPDNPVRLNGLAQAYESAGHSALVTGRLYRRALAIQPHASNIRVNYGRFLQTEGRLEEAEEQYRLAIEEEPWLTVAWHNLGTALLAQGRLEEASAAYSEALSLDPFYVDALGDLAALRAMGGQTEEAERLFVRAVEVAPENAAALGNLGAYRLNEGRLADAVRLLERAVAADTTFVDGLANLALAHFRAERYPSARVAAERALRLDPANALARQVLVATE